jgi:hypothetical protein
MNVADMVAGLSSELLAVQVTVVVHVGLAEN